MLLDGLEPIPMTKDELRRKYLLKSSTPTVQRLLWHNLQQDDQPRHRRFKLELAPAPAAERLEARRLYDEYHTELAHYQPVAAASVG
jgi:hypothetical protein